MNIRNFCQKAIIFALVISAAALAAPPRPSCAGDAVLVKQAVLSRHGVRSPIQKPAELAELTAKKWPEWPVKPGMLTARGEALIIQQWTQERARLLALGVTAPEVFICADSKQRTVQTAEAILTALSPTQDIAPVVYDKVFTEPLFHPVQAGLASFDKTAAYKEIIAAAGGSIAALKLELAGPLGQITNVCGPLSAASAQKFKQPQGANFMAIPSAVEFSDDGTNVKLSGGVGYAGSIAEIFLMEYCQWPDKDAGWGKVNGEVLANVMPVHADIFDTVNRAPHVAVPRASQLAALMSAALTGSDFGLEKIAPAVKAPAKAAKVSLFVGHDTNIAGVAELLGLTWQLPGFAPNQIPPGSCLVLSLWDRDGSQFVTAEFAGMSLAALHSDMTRPGSVNRVSIPLSHMHAKAGAPQDECTPDEFSAWVQAHTQPAK